MWSAISKIFSKSANRSSIEEDKEENRMDRGDDRRSDMDTLDAYDTRQAKQRASVKWLLAKAFNNKVPENLREPFYRDHENQEHLKPQIVGTLANAEIYCLALGNIYSDPNYHSLNHWSILQTLARKGVYVTEPSDGSQLTETTLIQTNPLRMSAHMAVIEAVMTLYAKEVVTSDRVLAAVNRFNHDRISVLSNPDNYEQNLLLWVSHACAALRKRMEQEADSGMSNGGGEGDRLQVPDLPVIKDFKDLCDGVALASLISFYCAEELSWKKIRVSYLPTVSESLHNLGLVQAFCYRCLPVSIFHLMPEDITYMRGSMKQNLIVFLADLFNILEIHPVKCVRYPGMDKISNEGFPARNAHGVVHKRNLPQSVMSPIPDLRSGLDDPASSSAFQVLKTTPTHVPLRKTNSFQQSASEISEDSLRRGSDDSFIVHKSRNIPTLSTVINDEPLVPARLRVNKEKQNHDSKAEERGEYGKMAAGKPSNWDEHKRPSYSGRRSRRNSITDDSQLTIENFGGSQENINFIGRNPDKEMGVHVGRKISAPAGPVIENPAVRTTLMDNSSSIQIGYDNGCEKQEDELENYKLKRQLSSEVIKLHHHNELDKENILKDVVDGEDTNRLSFANLKQNVGGEQKAIHLVYMQHNKEELPSKSSFLQKASTTNGTGEKKTTTFATLPNTTTWQQQSTHSQQSDESNAGDDNSSGNHVVSSQLSDIRMKLEEKRRHIENEKRRMEVIMNKQRQKVGKAAFLQAVTKGKGNILKTPSESECSSTSGSEPRSPASDKTSQKQRPFTLQEITDEVSTVERKWLDNTQPFVETRRTPDIENMDLEQYQQSIAQMNSSLHDIQSDIQRLTSQQNQMQMVQQQALMQPQSHHVAPYPQYNMPQTFDAQSYSQQGAIYNPLQSYSSAPHIPQAVFAQQVGTSPPIHQEQSHFYLHNQAPSPAAAIPTVVPQRRTWAQQINDSYQSPEMRTWSKPQSPAGFLLHNNTNTYEDPRYPTSPRHNENPTRYQNGDEYPLNRSNSHPGFTLSQQHMQQQLFSNSQSSSSPSSSPQHRNLHKQISQLLDESKRSPVSLQQMEPIRKTGSVITHASIPVPSMDDMEPQNISFIGNSVNEQVSEGIGRLNITSGSRTYRIPSPTRPLTARNAFQHSPIEKEAIPDSTTDEDPVNEKGFYISFDNDQPKRPKPPLRTRKGSPRKEALFGEPLERSNYTQLQEREEKERIERQKRLQGELDLERLKREEHEEEFRRHELLEKGKRKEATYEKERVTAASAIIIGNDLSNPDPDLVDEREKRKEKIMLMSLQRRQQQEEAKAKKEHEAQMRREREKMKEEDKVRKKEEQLQRRAAILEQYKLKKAIEEAEREGKTLDKGEVMTSLKPTPKMRPKGSVSRPRPKTIHIDSGSVEMAEGLLQPSRAKKGSSSNLTVNSYVSNSSMKRDYYRGSQDSLADSGRIHSGILYRDSPDDSRGMSPCHSANQTLGRRGSYKTSRGSSTDQDSLAYRYGDTDSGLGRATPPRRAPSPGMGPMRHLPSPSGPGSLPGFMTKRRMFDDGSSDISSTPSSMMDYTGPRLYKQPTTKSNRGIMLNAVEYCVFPGVVNKEAKRRVLEEINRSEAKHFLILFRDAGCQFRALYSYCPEGEEVLKLYGTGPKQVNDRMFDKFFKYNSGGKCFSQVHTKHLTVTIDAFTIHNSLWQGKKVNLPSKKDMTLVI
ncbi:patronin isoform X4 [Photinus pyralis]|nr:patronin isoform X4 [Photinus pyralis]